MSRRRALEVRTVLVDGVETDVVVDLEESPLLWLASRKGRDGKPMIDAAQFAAGERLRADFTRAQMTPRLSADWSGAPRATGYGGGQGLTVSEAALVAKQRFEQAITAVAPDFDDLLVDVCCHLKGLEQIERERGWPARCGKVMVRTALNHLARHYGYSLAAEGPKKGWMRALRSTGRA